MCWKTRLDERLDNLEVSVAGCLGYDVLDDKKMKSLDPDLSFSCWLFRL